MVVARVRVHLGLALTTSGATRQVWYMEFIGKGGFGKGALWVALRLPEGHVLAHANQARITTFLPCDDENTCRMAPDVVRAHPNLTLT